MDQSTNLNMSYIMASQAQKHVTHNEAIRTLDALVQLAIVDKDLATPPASPTEGQRYIPATGATGEWVGNEGKIAAYQDGAWMFYSPGIGFLAFITDENLIYIYNGTNWASYSDGKIGGPTTILNTGTNGGETRLELAEEEISLAGPSTDSTIVIPDRAIVFAVTTRTTQTVTGATSYDCGIAGDIGKFGSTLSIASGSTNSGVIGPSAFYADTAVRLSANGSDFIGGNVRLAIHYMLCIPPAS